MTKIADKMVSDVVAEASKKMNDPDYSAILVGTFVQSQTPSAQYVSAHEKELGGAEHIVGVIFHAAILAECFTRARGRAIRSMSYEDLDTAACDDPLGLLSRRQPSLSDFIVSNVENDDAKKLLAHLALAMEHVSF